jgi:hypothetical protein
MNALAGQLGAANSSFGAGQQGVNNNCRRSRASSTAPTRPSRHIRPVGQPDGRSTGSVGRLGAGVQPAAAGRQQPALRSGRAGSDGTAALQQQPRPERRTSSIRSPGRTVGSEPRCSAMSRPASANQLSAPSRRRGTPPTNCSIMGQQGYNNQASEREPARQPVQYRPHAVADAGRGVGSAIDANASRHSQRSGRPLQPPAQCGHQCALAARSGVLRHGRQYRCAVVAAGHWLGRQQCG